MDEYSDNDAFAAGGMAKNRVEALVDGIFGVAMTLLVLDVKLPQGLPLDTDAAMRAQLLGLSGNFRIYLVSFAVLGLYWIGHHLQFHMVRSVDRVLLWINLCFMFGITMIPFSTSVLAAVLGPDRLPGAPSAPGDAGVDARRRPTVQTAGDGVHRRAPDQCRRGLLQRLDRGASLLRDGDSRLPSG